MSDSTDATMAALAKLTGPGGEFEQVTEQVLGAPTAVMKHRPTALGEVLAASIGWGERDYLVTDERRLSFREHAETVAALAAALRERYGIGKGDRVGILAANTIEWVQTFWAAQSLGAIAVGYNAWWAPREIAYGVEHTEPSVLVVDAKRAALLAELDVRVPVLTMETDVPALIGEFDGASSRPVDVAEDDPAVVLYTSGTSGRPKGAVHSHRNLLAVIAYHRFGDRMAAAIAGRDTPPTGRRFLLTSPLFHIASLHNLVVPRLVTGDTTFIYQGAFSARRILSVIEGERVTNWGAMPTMAHRLLEVLDTDPEGYDLSSLASFSLNSAPSSAALQRALRARVPVARTALVASYGLTECSTAATLAAPAELLAHPDSVGRPIIGATVRIADAAGDPVPDGTEGEVWVHGAYVMLGYWNDEESTAAAITRERWLRTGDIGTLIDGSLRLSGRRSDLILRGGENVYPVEIEECLQEHPAVLECAVIGIPDADLGQRVGAIVVVENETTAGEPELSEFATQRLAHYKVPSEWRFTAEELPRNATGKVMRGALRM